MESYFTPYTNNGGTVVGIAGEDFAIIASDLRLSEHYMIHSRQCRKLYALTKKSVFGSTGFHGDCLTLDKVLKIRLAMYEHDHHKVMSASAVAAMLSTMMYYRRFFPYYTYSMVAGLDDNGRGCIYSYDPVGSYQREEYRASGSSAALIQPLLDSQLGKRNRDQKKVDRAPITLQQALQLTKDVFISAAERDIMTGDGACIAIIKADGIATEEMVLRKD